MLKAIKAAIAFLFVLFMLKKQQRLNKDKQFNLIFKKGRTSYGPEFGLKVMVNNSSVSRFAFIVSKKVSKRAVERNLIKRLLREAVRLDWLNLRGYDVIVVALPLSRGKKLSDIRKALDLLFAKLKISV